MILAIFPDAKWYQGVIPGDWEEGGTHNIAKVGDYYIDLTSSQFGNDEYEVFDDDDKEPGGDHEEYGKQWTLLVDDEPEHLALQIHEDSRYGTDLLRKIPKLKKGMAIKIMPHDFKDQDDQVRCGLSITDEIKQEKVTSYYQRFEDQGEGKKPKVINLYGYPEFDGKWTDKDETKVYFIKLAKFLRNNALEYLQKGFKDYEGVPAAAAVPADQQPEKDDLPF